VGPDVLVRKALPYRYLIPVALVLGLAPFGAQPHLLQKLGMLFDGTLTRPIDIFDLVLHGGPAALLVIRVAADVWDKFKTGKAEAV
jgi:hypothetical protein